MENRGDGYEKRLVGLALVWTKLINSNKAKNHLLGNLHSLDFGTTLIQLCMRTLTYDYKTHFINIFTSTYGPIRIRVVHRIR